MRRLYALLIAAALCFPSIGAMAWWHSIQQVGVSGGGPTPPAFVSPALFGAATYSNANRTVVMTAGSDTVRADTALAGKKVFSIIFDVAAGGDVVVGITTVGGNTNILGFDGNRSFGYFSQAAVWLNSINVVTNPGWNVQGTQVGIAIDVPNSLAWTTIDGTNYYGSTGPLTAAQVASGTSGLSISAITGTGTIYAAVSEDVANNQMTLQTAYPYAIPSGFSQY